MKTLPYITAATSGSPLVLLIVFWVLLILWIAGAFTQSANPSWPRANNIILIIELAILGYCTFGFGF